MKARAIVGGTEKGGAARKTGSTVAFTLLSPGYQRLQFCLNGPLDSTYFVEHLCKGNSTAFYKGGTTLFCSFYDNSSIHGFILTPLFYHQCHHH